MNRGYWKHTCCVRYFCTMNWSKKTNNWSLKQWFLLFLFAGSFSLLNAQQKQYTVQNVSPEDGILKTNYIVALTLTVENAEGMRFSLYSDNIMIPPGHKHVYSITPPGGFKVIEGSEIFKVLAGDCEQMVFNPTEAMTVKGNAASCQGVYNVTIWKPAGNNVFSLKADLMHGATAQN